ncbi:casein kinase II subunit alpha, putative [Entamoeba invadens IP1]|uniref:non-specific serine/threonine protein kinase n=1 Tax=Entamoeba invadens IP1 TaxID=370355 RepID=A0A0A1TVS5_ENTIV|nr:casein kinase II subunit alpha, putative [Entamoeba invadens IP1]ELP84577.1 casein kinase II subunit alpha, putative [Entamoeba invadens IP1]|eukprot:XP_004183923.1 casein kinase II subunit alpha, putative [Entamoeba invadens IP1]
MSISIRTTQVPHTSRVYSTALAFVPESEWNSSSNEIEWGNPDSYRIIKKVGRGRYSDVFLGVIENGKYPCAIKVLKPIKEERLKREILVLQRLARVSDVIKLYDCVINNDNKTHSLVMEYVQGVDFRTNFPLFTPREVQLYMKHLFSGLDESHKLGVMHRDIKPENLCYDKERDVFKIIDWGLAEFYHPQKPLNYRVASRYHKAPELLFEYTYYDYGIDVWGAGIVFATLIFRQSKALPLWRGATNEEMLQRIAEFFGKKELMNIIERCGCVVGKTVFDGIPNTADADFKQFINKENEEYATEAALDLLSKVLVLDMDKRFTASEALKHAYFKEEYE